MAASLNLLSVSRGWGSSPFSIRSRVRFRVSASEESAAVAGSDLVVNGERKLRVWGGNGRLGFGVDEKRGKKGEENGGVCGEELGVLWEDGYGSSSVKDYLDVAKVMIGEANGGPPRWFCPVECGRPIRNAPVLLFLPGMDGIGLGLILHHKALGRVFEVRCLHIPVDDRTPFEELVKYVESTVRREHALHPGRPVYIVGDSLGGSLALAVAARNPAIDLVLVLANPATSFGQSQLQPLLPLLEALPDELHVAVPYLLSFVMGEPVKMAMVGVANRFPPAQTLDELSRNLVALLPRLSNLSDIIPKKSLLWKIKLLKSAAAYANSRLHAVRAEVLVLASGKDNMLPSENEARRLAKSLQNCKVRYFKENGHTLLLEDGINLLAVLKGTLMYRHSRRHDSVSDYLPPSRAEFKKAFEEGKVLRLATSPVLLSTLEDGRIVRGLAGVPNKGPVILVGYHMLMGLEVRSLVEGFLMEKNIMVRGLAHPQLFTRRMEEVFEDKNFIDRLRQFGALPVTGSNLYKLLSSNSFILLYPGGAREALHLKGEAYTLFWPKQPEFVRMAARFGATIVPFGVVGEDDVAELVLDYNDLMNIPFVRDWIIEQNRDTIKLRTDVEGEVGNEDLVMPGLLPKVPGRFYYLFGKLIETKGKKEMLKDKENANALYLQVKSEIENIISYLKEKREKDPYRGIGERLLYRAFEAPVDEVPAFEP
ncbi:hypothetical protein Scep_009123 [Stephania cephalantha]|uniref:Serine aminopeptidase S33 domain-containing protein n=1 Tax=Stephania cephalantha TaxID=152367 RepID=A0AAP0JUY6_9MAGN